VIKLNDLLTEIFDEQYEWKYNTKNINRRGDTVQVDVKASFETNENNYFVVFDNNGREYVDINFAVRGGSWLELTGEDKATKVVSTVFDIAQDLWKTELSDYPYLKGYAYDGSTAKRERIYRKAIRSKFQNVSFGKDDAGFVTVEFK
jgi:hypothetical protein